MKNGVWSVGNSLVPAKNLLGERPHGNRHHLIMCRMVTRMFVKITHDIREVLRCAGNLSQPLSRWRDVVRQLSDPQDGLSGLVLKELRLLSKSVNFEFQIGDIGQHQVVVRARIKVGLGLFACVSVLSAPFIFVDA